MGSRIVPLFRLDSYNPSIETGFYYLQSRYYDPIVKRFLNADSYASTGTGFLGYNMFAYCENGPVNKSDFDGANWLKDRIEDAKKKIKAAKKFLKDAYDYVTNDDESVVLNTKNKVAFYKGQLVLKVDWLNDGAFSFGIMVIGTGNIDNQDGIDTVNHERGHLDQLILYGLSGYIKYVAIPAAVCAGITYVFDDVIDDKTYYNLPWDHMPDIFGNVHRETHTKTADIASWCYTVTTVLASRLMGVFSPP